MKTVKLGPLALGAGPSKICVPLCGANTGALLAEAAAAKASPADMAEWRADCFAEADDTTAVLSTLAKLHTALDGMPLLFTLRHMAQGGKAAMGEAQYLALNRAVCAGGLAHAIDIELRAGDAAVAQLVQAAHKSGTAAIVSHHDYTATPPKAELLRLLAAMRALGADLPKLAVMPQSFADVQALMATADEDSRAAGAPLIAIAMGEVGRISRVCGQLFGSCITFAALGHATAPGQLSAQATRTALDLLHGK